MKLLNRTEIGLSLLILIVYLLVPFFSDHIFSVVFTQLSDDYVAYLKAYKTPGYIAAVAVIIFLAVKLYGKKIRILQEQHHDFFHRNPMPMGIIESNSLKFLTANKAAIDTYGYSLSEFLSLSIADIRVTEELEVTDHDLNTVNYRVTMAEVMQHRKKNGEIILVEVSTSEIVFENKTCLLLLAHNITEIVKAREEKRIAEEEKIKSENFTSYVLKNFPVDVAVFDKDHRYIFLNKTAVKNDEMRKWMIGKDDFDYFLRKGTGMCIAENRRERFLKAISGESKEWIDEHVVNGKRSYVLRKFYPYYEDGELKCVYGYGMDITEVKKAQLQKDQYILQLEKIAFATSHKIRQPICNLQGLIAVLKEEQLESNKNDELIKCMHNSVNDLDDYTKDLGLKLDEYKQNICRSEMELSTVTSAN